jgi:hypothetical protein
MKLKVGDKVRVVDGAGLDSRKEGVIIHPSSHKLNLDGRGIPQLEEGHYKPFDSRREAVIEQENGRVFTMFWCCLRKLA